MKVPFGIGQIGKAFQRDHAAQLHFPVARVRADGTGVFILPDEAIKLLHGSVAQWSERGLERTAAELGLGNVASLLGGAAHRVLKRIGLGPDVLDYYWQKKRNSRTTPARAWTFYSSSPSARKSSKALRPAVISTGAASETFRQANGGF